MAKIHTLKISNYRGIKSLECKFGFNDFICLLGRGDSGKSTILTAISSVLSPRWYLPFSDSDFHNLDISKPIEIEATLYDVPASLLTEFKYGLLIRGIDPSNDTVHDELKDEYIKALTVRLTVDDDLEPKWVVISNRANQESKEISAKDRGVLNMFTISDHTDSHFSWNKGTALHSLMTQEDTMNTGNLLLLDVLREAKSKVDETSFSHMDKIVKRIIATTSTFGVDISNTKTTIDFNDISIKEGKISLHDQSIPFKLKGKGSKKLISIAIQTELAKSGGILLIDEIEQGLEPDRAQHLAQTLRRENKGQVFITTHSRDVIVELKAKNLFKVKQDESSLYQFNDTLQGIIRSNPEALFAKKVIIAEGATEVGFIRGLNHCRIENDTSNMVMHGVRYADGGGNNLVERSKSFKEAGYEVCVFCDSDAPEVNTAKDDLREQGITIIDCQDGNSIEMQLFKDLPWVGVIELIDYIGNGIEESLRNEFQNASVQLPNNWKDKEAVFLRRALGVLSKKGGWLKRIDHGEFIAQVFSRYSEEIQETTLFKEWKAINEWIES